ncbi:MAG TPA: hypothetical protein VGP31_04475 [Planosporangium sp.]|nr:hypothetical protein [Planosporangium sp.]
MSRRGSWRRSSWIWRRARAGRYGNGCGRLVGSALARLSDEDAHAIEAALPALRRLLHEIEREPVS